MALYKRGKTWWADFTALGERYRVSLGTRDWRQAEAREKELIAQATSGDLTHSSQQLGRLRFSDAADRHLENRRLELAEPSFKKERQLLVFPRRYFANLTLAGITSEALMGYRQWRARTGVGAAFINMEMGVLRRILKRAKRWHLVGGELRPLRERHQMRKALSPEEKACLLRTAHQRPEWEIARCAMVLALHTTMRGCELRGLRWRDVDLTDKTLTIWKSKTEAGERVIPLIPEAAAVVWGLRERARMLGPVQPEHFVFPACENGNIDPTHPQKSWRTAWRKLTRTAGLPGLRFHDLRHHAITELAESQGNEEIIRSIAGHVSPRMLHHYSHIRLDAKRRALEALSGSPVGAGVPEPGYVTKHVTMPASEAGRNPQSDEKNGRHVGTRTPDLYRVKVAL